MKQKEAFEKLVVNIMTGKLGDENKELLSTVEQALTELEALKRYPTSEEVREALQSFYGSEYEVNISITNQIFIENKEDRDGDCDIEWDGEKIYFGWMPCYPPHLISLIGRFYEGVEKK